MKFTYQPNFRDSLHGVLFGFWGTKRAALNSLLFGLLFSAAIVWALWDEPASLERKFVFAIAGGVLWILGFSTAFGAFLALLMTARQRKRGMDTLEITESGLHRTNGALSVSHQWAGIEKVKETSRAFFLFDDSRPVFSIEKSAIPNDEDLKRLRQLLRERKPGTFLSDGDA